MQLRVLAQAFSCLWTYTLSYIKPLLPQLHFDSSENSGHPLRHIFSIYFIKKTSFIYINQLHHNLCSILYPMCTAVIFKLFFFCLLLYYSLSLSLCLSLSVSLSLILCVCIYVCMLIFLTLLVWCLAHRKYPINVFNNIRNFNIKHPESWL